jgi:hypothetical protein
MTSTSDPAGPTEITIKRFLCRHIHTSGRRCGSPALRGEQFCYYHHTTRRPGPRYRGVHPSAYDFEMPDLDDLAGIQFALAQVLSLVAGNQIDPKRARLLLYGIDSASRALARNLRRISARSARHAAANSEDRSTDSCKQDLVEDLILDPDHGPIAPIAVIAAPIDLEEACNKRFAQMLNDLTYPRDAPGPGPNPDSKDQPEPNPTLTQSAVVIPTAATDSIFVRSEVEGPPHSYPTPATLPTLQAVAEAPPKETAPHLHAEIGGSRSKYSLWLSRRNLHVLKGWGLRDCGSPPVFAFRREQGASAP